MTRLTRRRRNCGPMRLLLPLLALAAAISTVAAEQCTCMRLPSPPILNLTLPDALLLHPSASYQTAWWMAHLTVQGATTPRTFGALYAVASEIAPDACPNLPILQMTALADSATGIFHQAKRTGANLTSTASPFTLGDSGSASGEMAWGVRQAASSPSWKVADFSVGIEGAWSARLSLDFGFPPQRMGLHGFVPNSTLGNCVAAHLGVPRVAASGIVSVPDANGTLTSLPVTGTLWYQNQWGTSPRVSQAGHLWVFAELSDGTSVQAVQMAPPAQVVSYANFVGVGGVTNTLLGPGDFNFTTNVPWTSPITHVTYDTVARLRIPSIALDITLSTVIPDNEVVYGTLPMFYEGVATVVGTVKGVAVTGNGYVEHLA